MKYFKAMLSCSWIVNIQCMQTSSISFFILKHFLVYLGILDSLEKGVIQCPKPYEITQDDICRHVLTKEDRLEIQQKVTSKLSK